MANEPRASSSSSSRFCNTRSKRRFDCVCSRKYAIQVVVQLARQSRPLTFIGFLFAQTQNCEAAEIYTAERVNLVHR